MSQPLRLHQPATLDDMIGLLALLGEEAKVVAGCTALAIMLRQRLIHPAALIDMNRLPDLDRIEVVDHSLRLGALVRHRQVELSPIVRARIPVLADTFRKVANVRIRNVATVGGVLAEADYASDPPAVLVALDAQVEVRGPRGRRLIPASEFFVAFYETALAADEIVTGVHIPIPPPGTAGVYEKFVTRSSEDRPCVGVAATVRLTGDGACEDLRLAVGAATEKPQRFPEIERFAHGQRLDQDVVGSVADRYADSIEGLDDMRGSSWYRTQMVRVWARRAIIRARDAAAAWRPPDSA